MTLALSLLCVLASAAAAGVPQTMVYQGLYSEGPSLTQVVSGTRTITFSLTDINGTLIAPSATNPFTTIVEVSTGVFRAEVPLDPSFPWNSTDAYLAVSVLGSVIGIEKIESVPYVAHASSAAALVPAPGSAGVTIANDVFISTWLGIGTTTKTLEIVHVAGDLRVDNEYVQSDAEPGYMYFLPAGAVMFFTLKACPEGWSEYLPLRGRFAAGLIPDQNSVGDLTGVPLSDLEERAAGQHSHHLATVHSHLVGGNLTNDFYPSYSEEVYDLTFLSTSAETPVVGVVGVSATAVPYHQVLACEKL